jgi:hypothetical protein
MHTEVESQLAGYQAQPFPAFPSRGVAVSYRTGQQLAGEPVCAFADCVQVVQARVLIAMLLLLPGVAAVPGCMELWLGHLQVVAVITTTMCASSHSHGPSVGTAPNGAAQQS